MQDSRKTLTMLETGQEQEKKRFLKSICPDFWVNLNACWQRLLFACQLTQQKCSLCSQGTFGQAALTLCLP